MSTILPPSPMILYTSVVCPYAQRVRMAIQEVYGGNICKEIEVDFDEKPNWYLKINPLGQVPSLQFGDDLVLNQSLLMVELMADLSSTTSKPLLPTDPIERAKIRHFIDRFTFLIIKHLNPIYTKGELYRIPELLDGIMTIQSLFLSSDGYFLGDDRFSVAEIAVTPFIGRFWALAKIDLIPQVYEAISLDSKFHRFHRYLKLVLERESFVKTFIEEEVLVERARSKLCIG